MEFKSWRDYYIFIKDYAKYSCLNCEYSGHELDLSEHQSDTAYSHHFCAYWMAMRRWDMQMFVCRHWKHKDTGKQLSEHDGDEEVFTIPASVMEKLHETDKKWSIEEIKELL